MITHKQWLSFCRDIRELMYHPYVQDVFIDSMRVVGCTDEVITTGKQGLPNIIYTFKDSVKPHTPLWMLQSKVRFTTTLRGIKLIKNLTKDIE